MCADVCGTPEDNHQTTLYIFLYITIPYRILELYNDSPNLAVRLDVLLVVGCHLVVLFVRLLLE